MSRTSFFFPFIFPSYFSILTFPSPSTIPARTQKYQPYSEVVSYILQKHASLSLSRTPYLLIVNTISNHVDSETVTTHCPSVLLSLAILRQQALLFHPASYVN